MSHKNELLVDILKLVEGSKTAILTTADASGLPHATWMNVMLDRGLYEVMSITAKYTQKVINLKANPQAEWMFASGSLDTMVYLSGPTVIVSAKEARQFWDKMPDKSKAFYLKYSDPDDLENFTIIRTRVKKAVYCRPSEYDKTLVYDLPLAQNE